MTAEETLQGKVASLERKEAASGAYVEFDLVLGNGQTRRVRSAATPENLREGDLVEVTGVVDANAILIGTVVRAVQRPVPSRRLWYVLAGIAIALAILVLAFSAKREPMVASFTVIYSSER